VDEKSDGQEKSLLAISVVGVVASFRPAEPHASGFRKVERYAGKNGSGIFYQKPC
jgi:hypothetical protein